MLSLRFLLPMKHCLPFVVSALLMSAVVVGQDRVVVVRHGSTPEGDIIQRGPMQPFCSGRPS